MFAFFLLIYLLFLLYSCFSLLQHHFQGREERSSFLKLLYHTHSQQNNNNNKQQKNPKKTQGSHFLFFHIKRQVQLYSSIFCSNVIFKGHTGTVTQSLTHPSDNNYNHLGFSRGMNPSVAYLASSQKEPEHCTSSWFLSLVSFS